MRSVVVCSIFLFGFRRPFCLFSSAPRIRHSDFVLLWVLEGEAPSFLGVECAVVFSFSYFVSSVYFSGPPNSHVPFGNHRSEESVVVPMGLGVVCDMEACVPPRVHLHVLHACG